MLHANIIQDCPVTPADVDLAEKIFGVDMSTLKGKSTRPRAKPMRKDLIEIPKELIVKNQELELAMDTVYINTCAMLTSIDRTILFCSLCPIDNRSYDEYFHALRAILQHYNNGGYLIKRIHCNGEYKGMMDKVGKDLQVEMNYTSTTCLI